MQDFLFPMALVAGWFVLNFWVLPKLGIST